MGDKPYNPNYPSMHYIGHLDETNNCPNCGANLGEYGSFRANWGGCNKCGKYWSEIQGKDIDYFFFEECPNCRERRLQVGCNGARLCDNCQTMWSPGEEEGAGESSLNSYYVTSDTERDESTTYYVKEDSGYRACVDSDFAEDGSFKPETVYYEKSESAMGGSGGRIGGSMRIGGCDSPGGGAGSDIKGGGTGEGGTGEGGGGGKGGSSGDAGEAGSSGSDGGDGWNTKCTEEKGKLRSDIESVISAIPDIKSIAASCVAPEQISILASQVVDLADKVKDLATYLNVRV